MGARLEWAGLGGGAEGEPDIAVAALALSAQRCSIETFGRIPRLFRNRRGAVTDQGEVKLEAWGRTLGATLLELLAPATCLSCEALEPAASGYCPTCGGPELLLDIACHVEGVPVFAGARYGEPIASVIQRFKYGAAPELCSQLAAHAVRGVDLLGIEAQDVWVPVPLHPLRLAERGYNQSALLARELARVSRSRVDARRLERVRHTEQQVKRGRRARNENVAQAFARRGRTGKLQRAERVVLVDDVVTTGATLAACIAALRAAGDEVVGCVAVAHASATARVPSLSASSNSLVSFWL